MNKKGRACRQAGFTLIELLVVMALLAILTIITVSQFETASIKARNAQRKADMSSLSKAILMYYADYQYFPDANSGLMRVSDHAVTKDIDWGGEFSDNAVGGDKYVYMKQIPKENKTGNNPYCYMVQYASDGSVNKFAILAHLELGRGGNIVDKDVLKADGITVKNITCNGNDEYNFGYTSTNTSFDAVEALTW